MSAPPEFSAPNRRHRVVVIGSGFGGLIAVKKLKRADVDIKLIARTTHHLFQPLLYQVATGIISEGEIAPTTRVILRRQRNVQVLLGDVTHIDLARKVVVSDLLGHSYETPYDSLIVAAGAGQSYFGNDQFAEFAPGMKSIDDALELRGRILSAFEAAERSNDKAICGARMHPNWFRIGGVAQDLPDGWDELFRDFLAYLPKNLDEYDRTVVRNKLFQARTKGIGGCTVEEAIDWGVTGPNLRAAGYAWDFRKERPYSGYEQYEFDIPVGKNGDCFDRAVVHVEEMRQSLRIIKQCVDNMPGGLCNAEHPLTTPPPKARTMHDIETLIHHFLSVSWGPIIPPGEALGAVEATKGSNGYYLISDGSNGSYRTRIRTPSFAHMQMLPLLCRGLMIPDLLAILGSMDYVLADIDR
jgi:hypothetical protein